MSPMTLALINYWHRLPAESLAARRKALDTTRERIRAGLEARAALVPFALGDVDDGIVVAATHAYVAPVGPTAESDTVWADFALEATEWVRRGLALNRGAVFGALLALEDERIGERLSALRLVLSAAEVDAACRVLGPAPGPRAVAFLQDWADLIADSTLQRERLSLHATIEAGRQFVATSVGARTLPSHADVSRGLRSVSHSNTSVCQCTRCTYARVSLNGMFSTQTSVSTGDGASQRRAAAGPAL